MFRAGIDYPAALSPRLFRFPGPIIRKAMTVLSIRRVVFGGVMGMKSVIAAAAVAVGIGQAEAASIQYDLRYEDTILDDATIWENEGDDPVWYGSLSVHGALRVLPSLYPGAKKGDLFKAYVEFGEAEEYDPYDGYTAPVCDVGGFDCTVSDGERSVDGESFTVVTDAFGVWEGRKTLTVTSWGEYYGAGFHFSGDGYWGHAFSITSTFTIVDLAPVPLPASAALLPMGIGALALMRRRRRLA